jgi:hypothetical protein
MGRQLLAGKNGGHAGGRHRMALLRGLLFCLACLAAKAALAQSVEAIAQAPIIAANGGVSLSQITTCTPRDTNAPNPFAYYLAGNLSLTCFGEVTVPLSFAYSNQQLSSSVSLPFNRFSIAPSYRWVKLYAGYASMQFSPYSMGGHEIFGGGVELTPDNGFSFSAIYGRLRKAVDEVEGQEASYRRMGGGFKVGYSHKLLEASVNLSKARDDVKSVRFLSDSAAVLPQDNLFGSASLTLKMVEHLQLNLEYGVSALNRNIGGADSAGSLPHWLLETSGDVAVYHALRTSISYAFPFATLGGTYERVAPNYTTLGVYHMANDVENLTANISTTLGRVSLAVDGGYQRDNLQGQKTSTATRFIFSGNAAATLGKKWSLSASMSNLQSYAHIRNAYDQATQTNEYQNLDTLDYTQLNYTASLNASYLIQSSEEQRQSVNGSFMYQRAAEKQGYHPYAGNDMYNGALSYQHSLIPQKLNASASVSYNLNQMTELKTSALSYSVSLQKTFWGVLRASFMGTYSDMFSSAENLAKILNLRLTGSCTLRQRHSVNLSLALVNSKSAGKTTVQYSSNVAYSYSFSASLSRRDKKWVGRAEF